MLDMIMSVLQTLQPVLAAVLIGSGIRQLWRGLAGTRQERGLLRRSATAMQRMEGFRTATSGLVLTGIGLGWLAESKLLVLLSLGIGIVELRESTMIIDAVKAAPAPKRPAATA